MCLYLYHTIKEKEMENQSTSQQLTIQEMLDWKERMSQKICLNKRQQILMKRINKALAISGLTD